MSATRAPAADTAAGERRRELPAGPGTILAGAAMLLFGGLVGAAVAWRRHPDTHKRLMLLATISLLDAAVARWPIRFTADWMFYAITDLFIVAAIAYDVLSRHRIARASAVIGAHDHRIPRASHRNRELLVAVEPPKAAPGRPVAQRHDKRR